MGLVPSGAGPVFLCRHLSLGEFQARPSISSSVRSPGTTVTGNLRAPQLTPSRARDSTNGPGPRPAAAEARTITLISGSALTAARIADFVESAWRMTASGSFPVRAMTCSPTSDRMRSASSRSWRSRPMLEFCRFQDPQQHNQTASGIGASTGIAQGSSKFRAVIGNNQRFSQCHAQTLTQSLASDKLCSGPPKPDFLTDLF